MKSKKDEKKEPKKTTKKVTKKDTKKVTRKVTSKRPKKKKNKPGFTLIELLAVIIILGIIMVIAIPSVTKYISNSRKNAYVDTAKEVMSAARVLVNEGELPVYDVDTTYYIPTSCLPVEGSGEARSPYGDFEDAYVIVTYSGNGFDYYWVSKDKTGHGVSSPTLIDDLSSTKIETGVEKIVLDVIGDKTKIQELQTDNCRTFTPVDPPVDATCIKATTLRTNNGKTFGTIWDGTSALKSGDALDCKVKKSGDYTERFYYVTTNQDNGKAVLIYYSNIKNDGTNVTPVSTEYYNYDNGSYNYYGPRTLRTKLPSNTQWDNLDLIGERTLKSEKDTLFVWYDDDYHTKYTIQNPFDYQDRVARLLTYQEVVSACGEGNVQTSGYMNNGGYMINCLFLLDGLSGSWGYWLENPTYSNRTGLWSTYGLAYKMLGTATPTYNRLSLRPVIEVPLNKITAGA